MTPKEKHTGKECKCLNNLEEICENTRAIRRVVNRILDHLHEYSCKEEDENDNTDYDPDNGQLIRAHNKLSILLGCYHIVAQFQALDQEDRHIRGIAGKCFYCDQEVQELLQKGQITVFDAERLALVCTDCGKITNSGQLCCPKHYTAVSNPDGTTTYLSPEDAEEQNRQKTTKTILSSIELLFGQNSQEIPQENCQDQNDD